MELNWYNFWICYRLYSTTNLQFEWNYSKPIQISCSFFQTCRAADLQVTLKWSSNVQLVLSLALFVWGEKRSPRSTCVATKRSQASSSHGRGRLNAYHGRKISDGLGGRNSISCWFKTKNRASLDNVTQTSVTITKLSDKPVLTKCMYSFFRGLFG